MEISIEFLTVFEDKLNKLPEAEREAIGRELSNSRADELAESLINGNYDLEHFANIHHHLFQDVSTHAGVVRGYPMSKGTSLFATPAQIIYLTEKELPQRITALNQSVNDHEKYIDAMTDLHSTLDLAHPFREGNGRATRAFMSHLANEHGYELDFSGVECEPWVEACIHSVNSGQETLKRTQFEKFLLHP